MDNKKKSLRKEQNTTGGGPGSAGSTPGFGAQYTPPFAFNPNKKAKGTADTYAYRLSGFKPVKTEGIGATLGPGPKATEKGVKDNYYVKGFKYKLVPDKIKGSGLEVKPLWEEDTNTTKEFHQERIGAFEKIENELNDIYKMLSNAKNKTAEYYNQNPGSYSVVYPTDLVLDYIKDIKDILTQE
jgi:hypothetical protein